MHRKSAQQVYLKFGRNKERRAWRNKRMKEVVKKRKSKGNKEGEKNRERLFN
jgi:hypothetical protein